MKIKKSTIEKIIKEELAGARRDRLTDAKLRQHVVEELREAYDPWRELKSDVGSIFSKDKPSIRSYTAKAWKKLRGDGKPGDPTPPGDPSTQDVIDELIIEVANLQERVDELERQLDLRPIPVEDDDIISSEPAGPPPLPQP
tara:strand:- start:10285 stop:10710 length:426 start_codon:yes stop_codon:yes gene_type:complete